MALGMTNAMIGGGKNYSHLPAFTYSGTYSLIDDGDNNWRIKFLTSGVIRFEEDLIADVFCVGGGGAGSTGGSNNNQYAGGGGGGYTTTEHGVFINGGVDHTITIGAGGTASSTGGSIGPAGGNTSAFNVVARGANNNGSRPTAYTGGGHGGSGGGSASGGTGGAGGTNGGNGIKGSDNYVPGVGQGTTTREFGESSGTLYSGGGGGSVNGKSGAGGGAYGGAATGAGYSASANTGGGGGGGGGSTKKGGNGGSGIVVIRNQRS